MILPVWNDRKHRANPETVDLYPAPKRAHAISQVFCKKQKCWSGCGGRKEKHETQIFTCFPKGLRKSEGSSGSAFKYSSSIGALPALGGSRAEQHFHDWGNGRYFPVTYLSLHHPLHKYTQQFAPVPLLYVHIHWGNIFPALYPLSFLCSKIQEVLRQKCVFYCP